MTNIFNQANSYIGLWCLYYLQGIFYPSGSILSQGVFLIVILISLYNVFIVNIKYRLPKFFKMLNVLVVMFTVYGMILLLSDTKLPYGISKHLYLQEVYISLLPIYSGYLYSKKGQITSKSLSFWIPFWFLVAVSSYYSYQQIVLSATNAIEITNNAGYDFLALIPVISVIYNRRPIIQYVSIFICVLFMIVCMKRGPILIAALLVLIFLWTNYKNLSRKRKIYIVLLTSLMILATFYFIMFMMNDSPYFLSRIEDTLEGNSSSRDYIYGIFWHHFVNEKHLYHLLFGHGANATLLIGPNYAHNDWLEILINQGVFGVIVYLLFLWEFFRSFYSQKSLDFWMRIGIGMCFIVVLLQTVFSMSYSNLSIFMSISLGYFLSKIIISSKMQIIKNI